MFEVDIDGVWNKLENIDVLQDDSAVVNDGRITLSQNRHSILIKFKRVGLTASIRLTVYQADMGASNNMVITEVIVRSKTSFFLLFLYL